MITPEIIEIVTQGPQGPQGPGGSGLGFSYQQVTPAATWTINHNLNTKPAFTLVLSTDLTEPVHTSVTYPSLNTAVIEWPSAQSGWVYA